MIFLYKNLYKKQQGIYMRLWGLDVEYAMDELL